MVLFLKKKLRKLFFTFADSKFFLLD